MIKKLRFKFVLINMGIVTLMLCVILGLVLYFTSANLERQSIQMMQAVAASPAQTGQPGEQIADVDLPFFMLQLDPQGQLQATGGGYYDLSDQQLLDDIIAAVHTSGRQLGVLSQYHLRYYRVDTPVQQVLVFTDISSEQATLDGLRNTCFLIGGISFLLFLWGSVLLSKWAVRPVERAWAQQRQFVASASHELKTPLTVIMTNAELLQEPAAQTQDQTRFLDGILTMSRQMRTLIEQMLTLARADCQTPKQLFGTVDLSQTVNTAALPFEPVFFESGRTLHLDIAPQIAITGDATQLRQLVEILLDNARKYSREHGATWVSLSRRGRRCLLQVENEGAPIEKQELHRIFQRFYRAASPAPGSFGLGLSIAQSITRQHRGKIWAESENGRNRFLVELPCHPTERSSP